MFLLGLFPFPYSLIYYLGPPNLIIVYVLEWKFQSVYKPSSSRLQYNVYIDTDAKRRVPQNPECVYKRCSYLLLYCLSRILVRQNANQCYTKQPENHIIWLKHRTSKLAI